MSTRSRIRFLLWLAAGGTRLRCVKLAAFTVLCFPYLLVLQKRAEEQPKSDKRENPFTYRLQ